MKTKNVVIVGILVAAVFFVFKTKPKQTKQGTAVRMELFSNVSSPTNAPVYFKYPTNGQVWFVFAQGSDARRAFNGVVTVATNGGVFCRQKFSSDDLKVCDWLYDKHAPAINAFALNYSNGADAGPAGNWPLQANQTYSAAVSIDPTNAEAISLWLCWFGKQP
jgi:hypothetical protein